MTPVNDALYRYVMNTRKVHTDDTPVVLAPGQKKAKQQGVSGRKLRMTQMWVRHLLQRSGSAYSPNRQGNTRSNTPPPPSGGILQADAFTGYDTGCSVQNVKVVH
ncbi:transposase [Escherichia coli]|uniref:IS66 family transposase n=1 Tax=Escherichia coli TaxID=562 RepID=UPI00390688C4